MRRSLDDSDDMAFRHQVFLLYPTASDMHYPDPIVINDEGVTHSQVGTFLDNAELIAYHSFSVMVGISVNMIMSRMGTLQK